MAWSFGHQKQMLMDGTFNVCSSRVLLFILMVIDDENRGIPVPQIIFSARQEAKATHADYNGQLLKQYLSEWKSSMAKARMARSST
jgi:hypothetical protein